MQVSQDPRAQQAQLDSEVLTEALVRRDLLDPPDHQDQREQVSQDQWDPLGLPDHVVCQDLRDLADPLGLVDKQGHLDQVGQMATQAPSVHQVQRALRDRLGT